MKGRILPGFQGAPRAAREAVARIDRALKNERDPRGRPLSPAALLSLRRQKERLAEGLGPFGESMDATLQRRKANAALLSDPLVQRYLRSERFQLVWTTTGDYDCEHCASLEGTTPDEWPGGLPPPAHPNCDCVVVVRVKANHLFSF